MRMKEKLLLARHGRKVEIYSCVLSNALAYCFVLTYFGDEDGRDHIHTTVQSLRTDR